MKKAAVVFALCFSALSFSQTKLISHKSHSGSNENFRISIEKNLFDIGDSNLGVAPNRYEKNAVLDSVIFISKEKAILVTSKYCRESERRDNKIISSSKWSAGRETIYNHKLYSKNHSLDSIKEVLKSQYNFKNDIEKVVFVGYDNKIKKVKKQKKKVKKAIIPLLDFNSNFPSKPFLILVLSFLSLIVAFFTWKTTKFKTVVAN